jgi:hypothetical protein
MDHRWTGDIDAPANRPDQMTDFPEEDVNDEIFAAVDKIVEEYNNSKQVRDRRCF